MRMWRPDLVLLYCFNKKDKLIRKSVLATEVEEKGERSHEIILITLITIFVLLFCARSLTVFFVLLVFGLVIGIFGWIKLYKENGKI